MPNAPLKTFIIYARADEEYKKELLLHLNMSLTRETDGNTLKETINSKFT